MAALWMTLWEASSGRNDMYGLGVMKIFKNAVS